VLPTVACCMAATGGTLAALRAGEMAATTVTPRPSSNETTTVRADRTRLPPGRAKPNTPSSALRPVATANPAASPSTAAMAPTATASTSTQPRTWRRLAPRARSRPFSWVRWATVMANVFMMMNPPTTRAITAKISRKLLKMFKICWNEFFVSWMIFAPVTASVPGGSAR
jgi:hypothetical protein